MPSRIANPIPSFSSFGHSAAPEPAQPAGGGRPGARNEGAFSSLHRPEPGASAIGAQRTNMNGADRLAAFLERARNGQRGSSGGVPPATTSGTEDASGRPTRESRFAETGVPGARTPTGAKGAQWTQGAPASEPGTKRTGFGAAKGSRHFPGTGSSRPATGTSSARRPAGQGHSAYARARGYSSHHAFPRPSHGYAGAYAAGHFAASGYPRYVRTAWRGPGYFTHAFDVGRLLGFTYGFAQTAHGARMHLGFHFNGRFHTLHFGMYPNTPSPLFATLHSGYMHAMPAYRPYSGHYAYRRPAWHAGYGYAPSGPYGGYGHFGAAAPPPFASHWWHMPFHGAAPGSGATPHGPRAQAGDTGYRTDGAPRPDASGTGPERANAAPSVDQQPPDGFRRWHEVLGVAHGSATCEAVKARYRRDALRLHPDKPGGSKVAFQELQWAYATAMAVLDARERGEHVPEPARTA